MLDFLLSFEQSSLVVVFLASSDAHLMLDVAKLETLFLQLLLGHDQFFRLLIQFALHVVQVGV